MSKRISKYITSFDYFGTSLIVLSPTSGGISFVSFRTVTGAPVSTSASFNFAFLITKGVVKKLHEIKIKSIIKLLC